jgi:hypothetical protein
MKHLFPFPLFESRKPPLTKEQIQFLEFHTTGTCNYNFSSGKIDVDGVFSLEEDQDSLMGLEFGVVEGGFSINANFQNLKGFPEVVDGLFFLQSDLISDLTGSPQFIENCMIHSKSLKSLKGGPREVGSMSLTIEFPSIQNLQGAPEIVKEKFRLRISGFKSGSPMVIVFLPFTWNLEGKIEMLKLQKGEEKNLLSTLISVEDVKKSFKERPSQTLYDLVEVWNLPGFSEIKKQIQIPANFRDQFDLMTGFNELGLF